MNNIALIAFEPRISRRDQQLIRWFVSWKNLPDTQPDVHEIVPGVPLTSVTPEQMYNAERELIEMQNSLVLPDKSKAPVQFLLLSLELKTIDHLIDLLQRIFVEYKEIGQTAAELAVMHGRDHD